MESMKCSRSCRLDSGVLSRPGWGRSFRPSKLRPGAVRSACALWPPEARVGAKARTRQRKRGFIRVTHITGNSPPRRCRDRASSGSPVLPGRGSRRGWPGYCTAPGGTSGSASSPSRICCLTARLEDLQQASTGAGQVLPALMPLLQVLDQVEGKCRSPSSTGARRAQ